MRCEICGKTIGHDLRCPNYTPSKAIHYCVLCGGGIYGGEEYIENYGGEYRHYECFNSKRELIEWFGSEIKIMEDI